MFLGFFLALSTLRTKLAYFKYTSEIYVVFRFLKFSSASVTNSYPGWPRHRENGEFGSYFFQTGKTQGILL